MFSFSRSFFATLIAWLSTTLLIISYSYATKAAKSSTASPVAEFVKGSAILAYFVGIVVFPTCMLVVTPLLRLLPGTSFLWRPVWACAVGAVAGPVAMYLWTSGFRRSFFVPEPHDSTHLFFGICSAAAGTIFGFLYSRGFARSELPKGGILKN